MSSKFGSRYQLALLCVLCLALVQNLHAQAAADDAKELELVIVGEAKTALGNHVSFHIYKAPDGTTGRVEFRPFDSLQAAEKQIEDWTNRTTAITGREHYDDDSSHGFNDRILAEWKSSTDPEATLVVIIRRDRLSCYHIVSPSLQVAEQIEQLIDTTPHRVSSRP